MNATERMEYPAWEAILAFQHDGKPITPEAMAAFEALIKQLRATMRTATEAQGDLTTRLKQAEERAAAWHARFQQLRTENNALRRQVRELTPPAPKGDPF